MSVAQYLMNKAQDAMNGVQKWIDIEAKRLDSYIDFVYAVKRMYGVNPTTVWARIVIENHDNIEKSGVLVEDYIAGWQRDHINGPSAELRDDLFNYICDYMGLGEEDAKGIVSEIDRILSSRG